MTEETTSTADEEQISDFRKGARAMFDYIQFRVANHYHGRPEIDAICQKENAVLLDWIEDALDDVDPESLATWKSLDAMYASGYRVGKAEKVESLGLKSMTQTLWLCKALNDKPYAQYLRNTPSTLNGLRLTTNPAYAVTFVDSGIALLFCTVMMSASMTLVPVEHTFNTLVLHTDPKATAKVPFYKTLWQHITSWRK
jgi:hypothetical protein